MLKKINWKDPALLLIIGSNLFIIGQAIVQEWTLFQVVFTFWLENIVIGGYAVVKFFMAKDLGYSVKDFLIKILLNGAFTLHFGFWCALHGIFIILMLGDTDPNAPTEILGFQKDSWIYYPGIGTLILSHGFSFFRNYVGRKEYEYADTLQLMTDPYRRIVLAQIIIIVCAILMITFELPLVVVLFLILILKAGVDIRAYWKLHFAD